MVSAVTQTQQNLKLPEIIVASKPQRKQGSKPNSKQNSKNKKKKDGLQN